MNITFQTVYDQKALQTMARALRKTVRKKHSRRSHIFGWIVAILGLVLSLLPGEDGFAVTGKTVLTWLIVAVMVVALIWEDRLNGYFAGKRALPGTNTPRPPLTRKATPPPMRQARPVGTMPIFTWWRRRRPISYSY